MGAYYGELMQIPCLEIVATDVETVCALYSKVHGVTFGDVDPDLGGARTARLQNGGMLGVRAPMVFQAGIESGLWQV